MSDLLVSAIITLCVALAIGGIFLANDARKKRDEQALSDYCRARGYILETDKQPLRAEIRVGGERFALTSTKISQRREDRDGSGSSSPWEYKTTLTMSAVGLHRPSYRLGRVPRMDPRDRLPDIAGHALIHRLMADLESSPWPEHARYIPSNDKTGFLLFERTPGEADKAAQTLVPLLEGWPAKYELFISSEPGKLSLFSSNCFIDTAELLDRLIRIGEAACDL